MATTDWAGVHDAPVRDKFHFGSIFNPFDDRTFKGTK